MNDMNRQDVVEDIVEEIKKVIIGKDYIIEKILMALLAKGHVLLEDIPGVGKTTLALAFSKVFQLDYRRIQFTPDTMPSDVIGFSIYNKELGEFQYKQGAIMANMVLADEINRTSSKTQAALLEAMEEGNVTVDGRTYELPPPFIVIATQNPYGSAGTQMLPESQLDRFLICLSMGYPDKNSEVAILRERHAGQPLDTVSTFTSKENLLLMQEEVNKVQISEYILEYITELLHATRNNPYIDLGVSPRGGVALTRVAKARAYLKHRSYVIPEDIMYVFSDVCSHRILLNLKARTEEITSSMVLKQIIEQTKIPRINL